jgi:pyruvate kinase
MNTNATTQSIWDVNRLDELTSELLRIRSEMLEMENRFIHRTQSLVGIHRDSARNLLHYLALRRRDIRPLQDTLAACGLSSLGRSESRVLANLDAVLKVVAHLAGRKSLQPRLGERDFADGKSTLERNTVALLGPKPDDRDVRIMVTMPAEAASDYGLIRDLVKSGMNCMRVNCAHDHEEAWASMVENLRRAERELDRKCRVLMDLPGPKLRTGDLEAIPGIVKWSPRRDRFGVVIERAKIWLTPMEHGESCPEKAHASLMVPGEWLNRLRESDTIKFLDARGRARSMEVTKIAGSGRLTESAQTAYVTSETILHAVSGTSGKMMGIARLGELAPLAQPIILRPGDMLILAKSHDRGKPAVRNEQGAVLEPATIGVSLPEIFADVRAGEKIWFDDGKIGGMIHSVDENEIRVEIVKARLKGEKLWADKGINLPDSELRLPALTHEDIALLPFIARHSDLVGYSFVRSVSDVHLLQSELAKVSGKHLGIVLKIETRKAFERLPELILAAMGSERIGVMIARGDLAVECGYERTGELQEEIMWIAEAAHVPVIWATQVLENLAKKGQLSRAEISDAAMAERAECVMLNKGPYVIDAVRVLDDVLRRMQGHQAKKASLLRPLTLADRFCQGQAT